MIRAALNRKWRRWCSCVSSTVHSHPPSSFHQHFSCKLIFNSGNDHFNICICISLVLWSLLSGGVCWAGEASGWNQTSVFMILFFFGFEDDVNKPAWHSDVNGRRVIGWITGSRFEVSCYCTRQAARWMFNRSGGGASCRCNIGHSTRTDFTPQEWRAAFHKSYSRINPEMI